MLCASCGPQCAPCKKRPQFAHAGEQAGRLAHMSMFYDRYDNFYNGYNEDRQMLRRVCCNPFLTGGKWCRYCLGNN